jgi:hypothetical protein
MEYWEPEEVDAEQYDLEDDPYGMSLFMFKEAIRL